VSMMSTISYILEQALDSAPAETGSPAQTKCLAAAFFKIKLVLCISTIETSRASLTSLNLEYSRKKDASTAFLQVHGHNIANDIGLGLPQWSVDLIQFRLPGLT
jgi:hypothetical protein